MWQIIKKYPPAVAAALLVHVLFVLIVMVSIDWSSDDKASGEKQKIEVIQAEAVYEQEIEARVEHIREAEREKRRQEQEKKRQAEQARQRELQRQAELKKKEQERKRQAALKKQREAEEKQRKEEEARRQAELKKQAEEKRKQEEARKQREAEQRRQQELAEQALKAKLEEEARQREREARLAANRSEINKYEHLIKQQVIRNWRIPPTARSGMVCKIMVRLLPSGDVVSVQVVKSSGDPVFDRSVEDAVYSAAPLPVPGVESGLFDEFREVKFSFDPKNRL